MFSERIKKIRKDLSLSQEEFSDKIGISIDTIQKWEKGTSTPRISVAEKIANILETSLGYLIGTTDSSNEKHTSNENMFFFKSGGQEVKIPNTEENKELFLAIVEKMVNSCKEPSQAKINMQDNINSDNNVKMWEVKNEQAVN